MFYDDSFCISLLLGVKYRKHSDNVNCRYAYELCCPSSSRLKRVNINPIMNMSNTLCSLAILLPFENNKPECMIFEKSFRFVYLASPRPPRIHGYVGHGSDFIWYE